MLTNVSGTVTVTNEGVLVEKVHAEFNEGELFASMNIHGGDFELQVDGTNWPISKKLVYLLPPHASANLARSWQLLEPTGELDAMIQNESPVTGNHTCILKQFLQNLEYLEIIKLS